MQKTWIQEQLQGYKYVTNSYIHKSLEGFKWTPPLTPSHSLLGTRMNIQPELDGMLNFVLSDYFKFNTKKK